VTDEIRNAPHVSTTSKNPKLALFVDKGDPLQFVAAHELAHTLGSHHRKDEGLLMSDYYLKQGFLTDKDTLAEINPPSKI
jgi:hypothetical protein